MPAGNRTGCANGEWLVPLRGHRRRRANHKDGGLQTRRNRKPLVGDPKPGEYAEQAIKRERGKRERFCDGERISEEAG